MRQISHLPLFSPVLLAVLTLIMLSSCSMGHDEDSISIDNGKDSATISFNLSNGGQPATYALDGVAESHVANINILLFDVSNKLVQAPISTTISTGSGEVTAQVPIARYGNILILANSAAMVDEQRPNIVLGMSKEDVIKLFKMTLPEKWDTDTSSPTYVEIPMYAETGYVQVNGSANNNFSASLLRMLVRVDVKVDITGTEQLDLKRIYVYNRNSAGMLAPLVDVDKPNIPSDPQKLIGPLVYSGAEISTPNIASEGEIYLFEAAIVDGVDTKRLADATCLVVGGFYAPAGGSVSATESFYRIDFAQSAADSTRHYYDILRNHQYCIKIISVSGPGEDTPEEALNTEISRIEVTVLDWNQGDDIGEDVDGQDILRVAPGQFTLPYSVHTTGSINNKLKVSSTHVDGWKISKITDADDVLMPSDGWLNTSPVTMGVDMVSVILTENDTAADRVGYIYVSSGPRMSYKVKVTQREKPVLIGGISWPDYDGTNSTGPNDGDTNLTSITLEQTGTAPQTSTIKNGIITPELELSGSIIGFKVTYKNHTLTVPASKYLLIASTGTITISDGTLIGKPVHLHKMRDGLKDSYIQVSDVDLSDDATYANWEPIGVNVPSSLQFSGSYDGGVGENNDNTGFKIYNLNIDKATQYTGLFGYAKGGVFKNIHIASGSIKGSTEVGAIFGSSNIGTVTGCSNAATVTGTANFVGGISGLRSGGTMSSCINTGTIKGTDYAGGITGRNNSGSIIADCVNTANITGKGYLGGICGQNASSNSDRASLSGCTNSGKITGTASYVGGICGYNNSIVAIITKCANLEGADISGVYYLGGIVGSNSGTISFSDNNAPASGTDYIGGIVGYSVVATAEITNCTNFSKGVVSGVNQVGGIAGEHLGVGSVTGCSNAAAINGEVFVGGLFGKSSSIISGLTCSSTGIVTGLDYVGNICGQSRGAISDFTNTLPISAAQNYAGGICGENRGTVKDCVNSASIEATVDYIGGICGMNRGVVEGCENASMVSGRSFVGGICGGILGANTEITNCLNSAGGDVKGVGAKAGGIVGVMTSGGTVSKCSNYAIITGGSGGYAGGICGDIFTGQTISGCLNAGAINGTVALGGIAGENSGAIYSSVNIANVVATGLYAGGIVGNNYGTVSACYNTGWVNGTGNVNAVAKDGTITSCYFGGGSSNLPTIAGTTLFGDGTLNTDWPTESTPGWSITDPDDYWGDLGGWSAGAGGTPLYPTLKSMGTY